VLIQSAWTTSHTKDTYWAAAFKRVALRRGHKRALVALGRKILTTIYCMLKTKSEYKELGADYLDKKIHEKRLDYYKKQLEKLGCDVQLSVRA
jgi:hypothetical protein